MPDDAFCAGCGYSLRGLAIDGHCPECGMPNRFGLAFPYLQDFTSLDREFPCLCCEYNLRGLSVAANCPECGRAIIDGYRFANTQAYEALPSLSQLAKAMACREVDEYRDERGY